jgi:hypothetical protein
LLKKKGRGRSVRALFRLSTPWRKIAAIHQRLLCQCEKTNFIKISQ